MTTHSARVNNASALEYGIESVDLELHSKAIATITFSALYKIGKFKNGEVGETNRQIEQANE